MELTVNPMSSGNPVAVGTAGAIIAGQIGNPLTGYFDVAKPASSDDYAGILTTGGTSNLIDSTKSFPITGTYGGVSGRMFCVTGGTGVGQSSQIFSNTATQINLLNTLAIALDTTSTYAIYKSLTMDGIHPSSTGHTLMANTITTSVFKIRN